MGTDENFVAKATPPGPIDDEPADIPSVSVIRTHVHIKQHIRQSCV